MAGVISAFLFSIHFHNFYGRKSESRSVLSYLGLPSYDTELLQLADTAQPTRSRDCIWGFDLFVVLTCAQLPGPVHLCAGVLLLHYYVNMV
jgi:hypothetical protein